MSETVDWMVDKLFYWVESTVWETIFEKEEEKQLFESTIAVDALGIKEQTCDTIKIVAEVGE